MAPQRRTPRFAARTLQRWFEDRGGARNPGGRRVVLFPDTFTNHFHAGVGVAAVEALEAAGVRVEIPRGHVCCGRPLYDYGFLGLAERYLRRTLAQLRGWYRDGIPIVGLEPSCVAVLKDELVKLLPHDDDARRLAGSVRHFGELLRDLDVEVPPLPRSALVWGHCHQKATGGLGADLDVLRGLGVDAHELQAGCCGLAGSWGFEAAHFELSMTIGEHRLLPAVRSLPPDGLVVANGFSCRTQIAAGAGRRALHLAEVVRLAQAG